VAIKFIRPYLLTNRDAVNRFRTEIQAAARLLHPNLVTLYDAEIGEVTFYTMEFVEGEPVSQVISRHADGLLIWQARDIIRQAALGLEHIHERGLVHRDIKPHNMMLGYPNPVVKLLDTGLALLTRPTEDPSHVLGEVGRQVFGVVPGGGTTN